MNNNETKLTIPQRVKHFIFPEEQEDLFKEVVEYNNYANYSLESSISSRSVLNALKDVPAMIEDPICSASVKAVMQTAFQPDNDNKLFKVSTPYEVVQQELDDFHQRINADNICLINAYNCLLWGQLPWKHCFNSEGVLERVMPIPDFTAITPIIISGKIIGYTNEKGDFVPSYKYTYAQLEYYKNLGGNSQHMYLTFGNDDNNQFRNEFTYANSYLSTASKPWRNINTIEDGLLLNRMDQSNYYRIISVNVGGQVYSKSAIQVLNYYRNLFKKVRRINYDSNGMSSRGNGQEFEVIVPQTQNQGVNIQNVGGEIDVKALKDLDVQYQRLFAALQIQPSMIGFSDDTPSSLGDSAAKTWDKRFAKVCKTVSFSTFNALKNIDYIHLRSLGYNVSLNDWNYTTVSQTIMEDQEKGETLSIASENLQKIAEVLNNSLQIEDYNKEYLAKTLLGSALSNYGIDVEKLLEKEKDLGVPEDGQMMIGTSFRKGKFNSFKKEVLASDAHVMALSGLFEESTAKQIVSAFSSGDYESVSIKEKVTPMSLKKLASSFAVKRDNPIDLTGFVVHENEASEEILSKYKIASSEGTGVDFNFPIYCSKDIEVTAGDLDLSSTACIKNLCVDENGNHHLTSKADVCAYLYNFMNSAMDNYVVNVWKRNGKLL